MEIRLIIFDETADDQNPNGYEEPIATTDLGMTSATAETLVEEGFEGNTKVDSSEQVDKKSANSAKQVLQSHVECIVIKVATMEKATV